MFLDVTERKQAEERVREHYKNIELLSDTATRFVDFPLEEDIYGYIGDRIRELAGESIVIVNSINDEGDILTNRVILGLGKIASQVADLLGRDPTGMTFNPQKEALEYLSDRKLHDVNKSLYVLLQRAVPKPICMALEKLYNIGKVYTMGFAREGRLLGTALLFLRKGRVLRSAEFIETFINQASIALQRRQAVDALARSEERYRTFADNASDAFFLVSKNGKFLDVNEAACEDSGYTREELLNLSLADVDSAQSPVALSEKLKNMPRGESFLVESVFKRKNGEVFPVEIRIRAFGPKSAPLFLALARDISERKQTREALRESEEKYRTLVEHAQQGVIIAQANPVKLRFANPAMSDISGYEEHELLAMDERKLPVLIHADDRQRFFGNFKKRIAGNKDVPHQDEYRIVRKDGTTRWVSLYSSLIDYLGQKATLTTFVDITERKTAEGAQEELESQLRQAQKMEAVGRLAGGVAHDFNNLLMGIMNYAELCRDDIAIDHPSRKWLDEITHEAERSARLTQQLLAFARKQTVTPAVISLNGSIGRMLTMLQRLIGEDIDLVWRPGVELGSVKIDVGQLDQILTNLCVNARDAISGVGKLTIETKNMSINEGFCAKHAEAVPGDYVLMAVSDNGHGMDVETLGHAFEPFFTTKSVGEGTGLGLATVYGIVRQNDGFVNVHSEPGHGTTFRIYLPRVDESVVQVEDGDEPVRDPAGKETLLLVEDERSIRETLGMLLERLGYTVLSAEDPEISLRVASEHPGPIDLLITDIVMPGMSGRELAERLLESQPSMKVLYMSGYTAEVIAHRGILDTGVHFLSKPVSSDDLAQTVRQLLDAP